MIRSRRRARRSGDDRRTPLIHEAPRRVERRAAWSLFLCGLAALFWELVLIRWLGSGIRVVAYYSNFVLIAAFFGLGAGALLAGRRVRLQRLIFPALAAIVLLGAHLGDFFHLNPGSPDEYVWLGAARGIELADDSETARALPLFALLALVYAGTCAVFLIFGQWIGRLFRDLPPLRAYSIEISGSICGIVLFALLSWLRSSPAVWLAAGFILLAPLVDRRRLDAVVAVGCAALTLAVCIPRAQRDLWSPYYKIEIEPLTRIQDKDTGKSVAFDPPIGHALTVNNDYHQMMLDLRPRPDEHPFVASWRRSYDYPYRQADRLPPGPVLVVGAGTGNDVSAALRNTNRAVVAVEIDPVIAGLGRDRHPERPYQNPRVTLVIDDARSFFQRTPQRFALVVFGFLDSHTLLSSFSSLRLDNFVYTRESLRQARRILEPGGRVELTFASNTQWLHERLVGLLDSTFDHPTSIGRDPVGYTNGIVYSNTRLEPPPTVPPPVARGVVVPTDDWPFLYLRRPTIPRHYWVFMGIALALAAGSLLFLPRGQRRVRLPYFFLGAAFFLVETSNVINLSLLYGSTWYVNVLVFIGILVLVLLGNWLSHVIRHPRLDLVFGLLAASVYLSYAVPTSSLLALPSWPARPVAAVVVFLGPAFFASVVFATLIRTEPRLDQAYGSNVLGAVAGGVCEYASLVYGFKFLHALTLAFYLGAFLLLRRDGSAAGFR